MWYIRCCEVEEEVQWCRRGGDCGISGVVRFRNEGGSSGVKGCVLGGGWGDSGLVLIVMVSLYQGLCGRGGSISGLIVVVVVV